MKGASPSVLCGVERGPYPAAPSRRSLIIGAAALSLKAFLPSAALAARSEPGVPSGFTAMALAVTDLDAEALVNRAIRREKICDLACPTGSIIACDPLVMLGDWKPFARQIPVGTHPTFVLVDENNDWGERVGLAELRISDAPVQRWQMALIDESLMPEMTGDTISGYGVDAGMGCFCDHATQVSLRIIEDAQSLFGQPSYSEAVLLDAALAVRTGGEHRLTGDGSHNIALFSSGFGDGYYASYWGLDAEGQAARLVTSFGVFEEAAAKAPAKAMDASTPGPVLPADPPSPRDKETRP